MLSVNAKAWPADYAAFLTAVHDLETMFSHTAKLALERAGSLESQMQTLMVTLPFHCKLLFAGI